MNERLTIWWRMMNDIIHCFIKWWDDLGIGCLSCQDAWGQVGFFRQGDGSSHATHSLCCPVCVGLSLRSGREKEGGKRRSWSFSPGKAIASRQSDSSSSFRINSATLKVPARVWMLWDTLTWSWTASGRRLPIRWPTTSIKSRSW